MARNSRSGGTAGWWLLLGNLALSFYCTGTVWLVQLSSYPLWVYVGPNEFQGYHIAWWHSIWGPVLFPAGLAFASALALIWYRPARVPAWALGVGCLAPGGVGRGDRGLVGATHDEDRRDAG